MNAIPTKQIAADTDEAGAGLLLAVEALGAAHDRHEAERSDSTGTSTGDDGENRDSSN